MGRSLLREDLAQMMALKGEYVFEDGLAEHVQAWLDGGQHPCPSEPIMEYYNGRRYSNLIKMSMCIAAGRRNKLVITRADWDTATEMLFAIEKDMAKLFTRFLLSDVGKLADELVELINMKGRMPARVRVRARCPRQ